MESGPWDGSDITVSVDGLSASAYIYNCTVYDEAGNSANDTVTVSQTLPMRKEPQATA